LRNRIGFSEAENMLAEDVPSSMTVHSEVTSVSSLRKKGHFLVEMQPDGGDSMQIVTTRSDIIVGQTVLVVLPGTVLQDKSVITRHKIAGEWSEGVLVDIVEAGPETLRDAPGDSPIEDVSQDGYCEEIPRAEFQVLPSTILEVDVSETAAGSIHYVNGDASKAHYGKGKKIIAQVCNDMGCWGKGFVMAITDTWGKHPGKLYRKWHKAGAEAQFALGRVQLITLSDMIDLANIIGQNGIKTGSKGPPVRYEAIEVGLDAVCFHAASVSASVHMPRIGAGLAGGEWARIEQILEAMTKKHAVTIYVFEYSG